MKEIEELRELGDGNLDVLNDVFLRRLAAQLQLPLIDLVLSVGRNDLPIEVRTQLVLRPKLPNRLPLCSERARTPEPVGVPSPDVVACGDDVSSLGLDRSLVNLSSGVIAWARSARWEFVGPLSESQVLLTRVEYGSVNEIDRHALVLMGRCDFLDRCCQQIS